MDPALLRPGRIDRRIQYKLATKRQALALFERFFPYSRFGNIVNGQNGHALDTTQPSSTISYSELAQLGEKFASGVPEDEFSTAQLQGYLLMYKMRPWDAAAEIEKWVEEERVAIREKGDEAQARMKLAMVNTTAALANVYYPYPEKAAD